MENIYSKNFVEHLKSILVIKNIDQKTIAEKMCLPHQTVNSWFRGQSAPNLPRLCQLADALNVSLDYLVGRTDDPNPKVSCEMAKKLTSLNERQLKTVEAVINSFKE